MRGRCISCGERAQRLGWYKLCDVCKGLLCTFYVQFAWLVDSVMSQWMGLSPGGSGGGWGATRFDHHPVSITLS